MYPRNGLAAAVARPWGDYSSLSLDPKDGCTFWYTTEYLKTDRTFDWCARIGNFKMSGCNQFPALSPRSKARGDPVLLLSSGRGGNAQ